MIQVNTSQTVYYALALKVMYLSNIKDYYYSG